MREGESERERKKSYSVGHVQQFAPLASASASASAPASPAQEPETVSGSGYGSSGRNSRSFSRIDTHYCYNVYQSQVRREGIPPAFHVKTGLS